MEYGLFTTVIIMLLGGGAFLYATLTVEDDRKVQNIVFASDYVELLMIVPKPL